MRRLLLAGLLLSALSACGGGGDGNVTRTCDFPAEDFCDVFTGPAGVLDSFGLTEAGCVENGGTYGGTCSATGRVGRCSGSEAGITLVEHYYPPLYDLTSARAECELGGGTFTPN